MATRQIEPIIFEKLGRIVVRWAFLEKLIGELFAEAVEGEPGAMLIVTENISTSTVASWTKTLVESRPTPEPLKSHLLEILENIDQLRAERNVLVHGLWATDQSGPNTVLVQTIRWERREVAKGELITLADLDDLYIHIDEAVSQLLVILNRIKGIQSSSKAT